MSAGDPSALYLRPEAFQRERRSVFAAAWLLLGRREALVRPGDYIAAALGGWPVFAILGANGEINAFRNVCRHQGLPLFDSGSGNCSEIRCRYHGWTYDRAGGFIAAPPQVAPPDPADPRHRLERVGAALHQGLVFVHLGAAPPALAAALDRLGPALAADPLDRLEFQHESASDIDANWKLVIEQLLASAPEGVTRILQWPDLVLDRFSGGAVLHQIIARAFQRTRIVHYHYGADAKTGMPAALNEKALAAQEAHAAGSPMALPLTPGLVEFRARLRAAHPAATQ